MDMFVLVVNAGLGKRRSVFFLFMVVLLGDAVLVVHVHFRNNDDWLRHMNNFSDNDGDMFNLSLFDFDGCVCLDCSLELAVGLCDVFVCAFNLLLLILDHAGILLFEINTNLVVYE